MSNRKNLGKRLRFCVFARDNFTCRYCGQQPPDVMLVVDHVIPVAQGGTNDEPNLITSCESCNQGKAAKTIDQSVPTEGDRLRMLQEAREQEMCAKAASEIVENKLMFRQEICNYFCEVRGTQKMDVRTLNALVSYGEKYGTKEVFKWIDIASRALPDWTSDDDFGKYISGIKRRKIEIGELAEVKS